MKQKLLYLIFFILFINSQTSAQVLIDSDLIGKWSVLETHYLSDKISKNEIGMIEKQKKAFSKAKFIFKESHNFLFDIGINEMKITNGYWSLNKKSGTITISDNNKSKSVLMEIQTKRNGNQVKFMITETLFGLEMKKE